MTVVAIDGPAGAGKSTVARRVAEGLGFRYADTGAMYRALALAALRSSTSLNDGDALARLAASHEIVAVDDEVTLDGEDVSMSIREADVTEAVSKVAVHPQVRDALVEQQRRIAATLDVVMEGRDIGTEVVPEADVKIFLTASLDERAHRRWAELDPAARPSLEEIRSAIAERDDRDSQREASPLRKAEGAIEVDTTGLTIEQVVAAIVASVGTDR